MLSEMMMMMMIMIMIIIMIIKKDNHSIILNYMPIYF